MERHPVRSAALRPLLILAFVAGASLLGGCLDEPGIEETWTRIDIESSSLAPNQAMTLGSSPSISVRAKVTYRHIVTGFAVAELRTSSIPATAVTVDPRSSRASMANDIDRILQNSVTAGRMTRAVTGWDHLIQPIDFTFTGAVPATVDSSSAGLFLVCYLGSGTRLRLQNGQDSIVVTPFPSTPYEILPVGMELTTVAPGSQ